MAGSFQSEGAKRAAALIAEGLACEWCGVETEAKDLRAAFSKAIFELLLRIDAATKGASGDKLIRVLKAFAGAIHAEEGGIDGSGGREWVAAQHFAKWFCGQLPAQVRSLGAVIASLNQDGAKDAGKREYASTGAPAGKPQPMTKKMREQASGLQAAALPAAFAVSGWPSLPTLGKEIEKRLKILRKFACGATLGDIAAWVACVPLQAASSLAVATALKAAFDAVRLSPAGAMGLVKSGRDLGSVVHSNFATAVAMDFCATVSRKILVAEYEAYVPPNFVARRVAEVETMWQRREKDYSLTALAQSRGSRESGYIRRPGSTTSRDDLVVFQGTVGVTAGGLLGLEARPEVYELKPVDSLVSAVSQVTGYSWNYLYASVYLQCTFLPRIPAGKISNSVMIPASPENHSIRLPLLTITELTEIGAAASSPVSAAVKAADIVQRLMTKKVDAGPYIAIPFMISGLYGIIPYFVIDLKKIQQAVETVLTAIIEALIAALIAYLAAKKAFEEFLEKFGTAIVIAMLAIGLGLVIIGTLPASVVAALVTLAILVFVFDQDQASPEGAPRRGDEPVNIYLGAMSLNGITAKQFAAWMGEARTVFENLWTASVDRDSINVEPLL